VSYELWASRLTAVPDEVIFKPRAWVPENLPQQAQNRTAG
jgi:hypothetical protein